MPVFLSGLSDRMGKVSTVATAAVAFSVILSFLLRGRAGLWLLPMLSLLSASLVIAESVLFSRNDSPRVYTSSELQVVNIRTNVIYFLVFVLLLMTGAYIGDTDGFASDLSVCLCLVFLILLFNAMYGRMVNHRLFFFLKEYERKLIETADAFSREYRALLEAARAAEGRSLAELTARTKEETERYRDFKAAGAQGINECEIRSIILPLLADHVLREANHYLRILER